LPLHHQDFAANDGVWEIGPELLSPGHGLARPMKVGKEELVGAVVALKLYAGRDHIADLLRQEEAARLIASSIRVTSGVTVTLGRDQTPGNWVRIHLEPGVAPIAAREVVERLASEEPRIMVAASVLGPPDTVTIGTATLQPGEADIVARRLSVALSANYISR
jgi:D-glucosaminate-6-phosphate ammonia-lyase